MSHAYVSAITTNTTKPFSFRFLMAILLFVTVSLLFNIAIYGIFSTGVHAGWTKPVLGVLVLIEAMTVYRFWKWVRG